MAKIYALYKGETNLCDGTIEQLAQYLKVKPSTIYFYTTKASRKRTKNGYRVVYIGVE